MKHDPTVKAMMADLRCPVCSSNIEVLEVTYDSSSRVDLFPPAARIKYRCVRMVCSSGCEVSTKGYGSEALYRMMTNWIKLKKKLRGTGK